MTPEDKKLVIKDICGRLPYKVKIHIGKTDKGCKYMIEWRVWDWHKYIDRDPSLASNPYSLEVNILPDSVQYDMRLDMLIGDPLKFGFDKIEEIAENYHRFLIAEGIATTKSETE